MQKKEDINKKEILDKITPVIEKIGAQFDLIILEVDLVQEAGNWHLRIFIYNKDHSITHEDCEKMTKNLGEYLNQLIPVHYYLEISSPGLERKLKSPLEYNIFKGEKVEVKLKQPQDGIKKFLAKLIDYNQETGLKVEVIDEDKTLVITEQNISSIRLKTDLKI